MTAEVALLNGVPDGAPLTVGRPPRSTASSTRRLARADSLVASGSSSAQSTESASGTRRGRSSRSATGCWGDPVAPGLLGRWGLNENTGTTVADSSGHNITGTIVGSNVTWAPGRRSTSS
jgi:hypothetical protein